MSSDAERKMSIVVTPAKSSPIEIFSQFNPYTSFSFELPTVAAIDIYHPVSFDIFGLNFLALFGIGGCPTISSRRYTKGFQLIQRINIL